MRRLINKCDVFLVGLIYMLSTFAMANNHEKITFGGFASQGIVYTSANTFFDEEDRTSLNMTELALQANYLFSDNLRFSAQGIYRNWGKTETFLVDYLMADYQMALTDQYNLGFRIGRIKSDMGLVNTTRDIPNARPSIFLPQSVYQDVLRDTTSSYDGISIYGNQPLYMGRFTWSFSFGKYPSSESLNQNILDEAFMAEIKPKSNIQAMVTWESPSTNWLFSLGYDNPQAELYGNESAPVYAISDGNIDYDRFLFSSQYFSENWDFTFEYILQPTELEGFEVSLQQPPIVISPGEAETYNSEGFYGQFRYMINEELSILTRYERYYTDNSDKSGDAYKTSINNPTTQAFLRYHYDFAIGLKWQINNHWLFHIEGHLIEGTSMIAPIVKIDRSDDSDKNWQLYSAQISYSF